VFNPNEGGLRTMKPNEGPIDRIARVVLGIVLIIIGWSVLGNSVLGVILDIIGVILLITAITGSCAIYRLLGISTIKTPKE
jgi:membrane-bound ClpP family serine protease